MVRTYVRSTTRASWSSQSLAKALDDIKNGESINKSAKKYGIPEATVRRKLKLGGVHKTKGRLGRAPTFSREEEDSLTNLIFKISQLCYNKLSSYDIRKIAFEFAEENGIPHPFAKEAGLAGKEWYSVFIKRHKEMESIELQSKLTKKSMINRIKESVTNYFDNLEKLMTVYNFSKDKIFNVDITVFKIPKMKDGSNVRFPSEKDKNVTIFCGFSASGIYLPPLFFYPDGVSYKMRTRKKFFEKFAKNDWNKEEFLLQWLIYFQDYIKSSNNCPVLLILDCHFCNQMTFKIFDFCEKNGIVLLGIPTHTFHKLQPIDQNFIRLLRIAFDEECEGFFRRGYKEVDESIFPEVFDRAYTKVAMENDAKFAFESCGAFPFNRNKVPLKDFEFLNEVEPSVLQISSGDDSMN